MLYNKINIHSELSIILRSITKMITNEILKNIKHVHFIGIVQGEERLFVAMPSRRDDNGVFRDIVHPIDSELRNEIEGEILSAYRMELDRQSAEQQDLS